MPAAQNVLVVGAGAAATTFLAEGTVSHVLAQPA